MNSPELFVMPTAIPSSLSDENPVKSRLQIFWKADSQGQLTYIAPQWQEITGLSVAASLGDRYLQVIHIDDHHLALGAQRPAQPYAVALRLRQRDGTYVQLIAQAQPITDLNGQLLEWLGTFTLAKPEPAQFSAKLESAVAQRTAEMEASMIQVRDYVERVTLALDAAQMGMWDWDLATNQTLWNPYHEILLGYEPGTSNRNYQDWVQRVHPDDLERLEAAMQRCKAAGSDYSADYRVIWPDRSLHWVTAFGRFHYDLAGQPVRMTGMIWDISDRKRAEQKLQEAQEKFQATFEQAAVGLAHVDLNGRWLRVNQKLCEIVGYSHAELLTRTYQEITHPDDLAADLACVQQLLSGQIQTYVIEKRYLRPDQKPVWVNLTVSLVRQAQPQDSSGIHTSPNQPQNAGFSPPILGGAEFQSPPELGSHFRGRVSRLEESDVDLGGAENQTKSDSAGRGAPKYFIAVIEDICDRKAAELTLKHRSHELNQLNRLLAQTTALVERRNQELDQFVYLVSHDLKAPLRAISNLSQWISDDLGGQLPPENEQQLQLMQSRVGRMENLINGLLEYSRIGQLNIEIEPVAVGDLLAEIIDSLDPPPRFTIQIAPDLPTLQTKRVLLRQVFSNLISNAIKHHDRPDGRVEISANFQAGSYEFLVADDGPGIDPDQHERIFAMFQALNKSNPENTGIGLAIVKKIVESEAGQIGLESSLGKGTTFRFTWSES